MPDLSGCHRRASDPEVKSWEGCSSVCASGLRSEVIVCPAVRLLSPCRSKKAPYRTHFSMSQQKSTLPYAFLLKNAAVWALWLFYTTLRHEHLPISASVRKHTLAHVCTIKLHQFAFFLSLRHAIIGYTPTESLFQEHIVREHHVTNGIGKIICVQLPGW